MNTAEWICTKCKSVNRRLVARDTKRIEDRCLSCHTKHMIEPNDRPVRWRAMAK